MKNTLNISIIICCYNSENRIVPTLKHLANQKLESLNCELILIDNNCSDSTVEIAKKTWNSLGHPYEFRVIKETQSGLSFARKCGVYSAHGDIIIFCDDDNWLSQDYIKIGYEIIKFNREIGVLGGQGIAAFDGEAPNWFSTYQSSYAVGCQALYSGDISSRGYVWGAGCFVRKKIMIALYESGFESFCSGRKENLLMAGDDSEICKWHLLVGKKLWYDENLIFVHYMEEKRITIDYFQNLVKGFESSSKILEIYDNIISFNRRDFSKLQRIKQKLKLQIKKLLFYRNRKIYLNNLQLFSKSKIIKGSNPKYFSIISATIKYSKFPTEC